jgi:hypothetical protein
MANEITLIKRKFRTLGSFIQLNKGKNSDKNGGALAMTI